MKHRTILHIDIDAFFAAVEQLDNPAYRGKAVVIGADPKNGMGRGVVSTASYEARKCGVHSAMPISQAFRRCPQAVFLPPRFHRYREASQKFFEILQRYSENIEPLSIDEAFLDCTVQINALGNVLENVQEKRLEKGLENSLEKLLETKALTLHIQKTVLQEIGLTTSVGAASNKSIAKIASDMHKPNGITICPPGYEKDFLAPLPVKKLWGVGEKTGQKLASFQIQTIGDLASLDTKDLQKKLGTWGLRLQQLAMGIDEREICGKRVRKSISEEVTFPKDLSNENSLQEIIHQIAQNLGQKMQKRKIQGRTVIFKIRFADFQTFTRSKTIQLATDDADKISKAALYLYRSFDKITKKVRLLGLGMAKLEVKNKLQSQLELFP